MKYVMPEPPQVEGIEWNQDPEGNWKMTILNPVESHGPTDADLLDDKCTAMELLNRYYR